ncbi:Dde superfamily endonuclease cenp b [Plakobranchus ocellatus]|uniref:Dde superfamily endonuclease cenp b n=1 Tax=Plakobranchus ocellatus TaxID=259542 RepID=A0AAV4BWN6_9GAST|nr:Dde superfamily endonuclease cenp b [Plakobranchus ocellatus]
MKPKKKSKKSSDKDKSSEKEKSAEEEKSPVKEEKPPDKETMPDLPSSSIKEEEPSSPPENLIKKRRLYAKEALLAAYKAVKDSNISVNAAAKQYGVPLTTLRDRVDGRISIDTTRSGPPLLLAEEEEAEIAQFLHTMARYGYRYTRVELGEIATDQAVEKGKKNPRANNLTTKWVDNFVGRWPSIRELGYKFKNKADAEHTVRTYFDEIKKIIDQYKLLDHTDRVFNIMEIGLHTNHGISSPVKSDDRTENVSYTTMIACGSVSGKVMAPFFIYQAPRLRPEMMRGLPSNVNAAVSDTGKCTPQIFRRYLNEHFLPQTQRMRDTDPILVLMDGSRTHVFVSLAEWGRSNNVFFSFIPAHTTHLLQPLEVECAEQVQRKYENICRRYLKNYTGPCISRNSIGELACNAYLKVINRFSLVNSFRKAGVYPDISSDESEEEADVLKQEHSYHPSYFKVEDNAEDIDEFVYTGDLVVGHNEEVTEEEVITTTQEVLLPDHEVHGAATIETQGSLPQEEMVGIEEQSRQQQPSQVDEQEQLVITSDGLLMNQEQDHVVMAPSSHIVIRDGEIFVDSTQGGFSHLQPIELIQEVEEVGTTVEDDSIISAQQQLEKNSSDLDKISPLKQCIINDGKIVDTAAVNVLRDSAFNPVDQSALGSENLSQISPLSGHRPHHRRYHLSPSDNSSSSSNNSMFSLEENGLGLKPNDSSLDLSSSFSVNGESSRGSISPGTLKVIVKHEIVDNVEKS